MHVAHHAAHQRHRTGRAGHDPGTHAGEVEARELRVVQHRREHRRHPVHRGTALRLQCRERLVRIESLAGEHHGHAVRGRRQIAEHHAEAVVERHRYAERLSRRQSHRPRAGDRVVDDVVVGQRCALWRAGGTGGELDVDRIARPQSTGDRVEAPALAAAAPVHDLVEAEAPWRRIGAELDHGAELRQAFCAQAAGPAPIELRSELPDHLDVGGGLELPCGDERLRADPIQGVFELRGPVGGIDVDEDQPDARGGELGDQPLGPVRRPDSDPVSLVQTEAQESGREPVHPPRELLVGPAFAGGAEHRRGAFAVAAHDLGEERGKGRVDERSGGGPLDVGEAVDGGDAAASRSRFHHHIPRQSPACSKAAAAR